MKRDLQSLIYGVFLVLLAAGCAREAVVPVRQGEITAEEKEWLAKAY